jgi:predicted dehydrogenase
MKKLTRRSFIGTASAVASSTALGSLTTPLLAREQNSPNDLIRIGIVGLRGRGRDLINGFSQATGARIVALCDADSDVLGAAVTKLQQSQDAKLKQYADYRQLLDDPQIDVVAIATPNHWHALMMIEACQAGKHVYVEKPVCHSVWEGRKMIEAMHRHGSIVGAGFQNRSDKGLLEAFPWIHAGNLGKITAVRGLCNRNRDSIGLTSKPVVPPKSLNYDLWLGPAADLPIMRPHVHYDWHWDWNTGNGDMGNQGPHEMDLVRWALGDPKHPVAVQSLGGRFAWNDGGNTPNMQVASFDFGNDVPVIFEVRNIHNEEKIGQFKGGPGVGVVVTCEGGEFRGGRGGGAVYDSQGKKMREFQGDAGAGHMQAFVNAVREGNPSLMRAPLESSFYSSCMSHLANISVRTGDPTAPGDLAELVGENAAIQEVVERFTHQLDSLGVDCTQDSWHAGPRLAFDPQAEQFVAGPKLEDANRLLKRDYRKPFVVSDIV